MRVDEARTILEYAADIPAKLRTIAAEKAEIEGELNCLHGIEYGGMPHGSGHSDTTADIAERADALGYLDRLRMLEVQETILRGDLARIKEQIWALKDVYTTVISEICLCGHSFEKAAPKIGYSVSHTKRIKSEAILRLAEALDGMMQADEIRARAYNARK